MLYDLQTNSIVAKARAILGRCLTAEDYKQLINRRSVVEVASYLKGTERFRKALANVNEQSMHRGQIENILNRDVFENYERLVKYEPIESKSFYKFILRRQEIAQIMNAIMYINAGQPDHFLASFPAFLMQHASFSLIELAKARDFEQLLAVLAGTPYAKIIERYAPKQNSTGENAKINFTDCEVALYATYYQSLLQDAKDQLSKSAAKEMETTILRSVDFRNLITIFRMRVTFGKSPELIRKRIIPLSYKITKSQLEGLLKQNTADEMTTEMVKLAYFRTAPKLDWGSIERTMKEQAHSYYITLVRMSVNAPVVMYSLMQLLEQEKQNVTIIIEGIRYGLAPAEIEKMLIL